MKSLAVILLLSLVIGCATNKGQEQQEEYTGSFRIDQVVKDLKNKNFEPYKPQPIEAGAYIVLRAITVNSSENADRLVAAHKQPDVEKLASDSKQLFEKMVRAGLRPKLTFGSEYMSEKTDYAKDLDLKMLRNPEYKMTDDDRAHYYKTYYAYHFRFAVKAE
jgi:hypothetical protein